ncbi:MAG: UDP-N-acetylglucosamine 2-epimerase, partial [Actinomycetota bacterium]|nr:UDP-N-acetylglucosamine 2-epimerase [Actinomycetota bacterium]
MRLRHPPRGHKDGSGGARCARLHRSPTDRRGDRSAPQHARSGARGFAIQPDHDLGIGRNDQTLGDITRRALEGLEGLMVQTEPDRVVLQGDTTTAFSAALAGFYAKVPVAHVEAGLRTGDPMSPYPEEVNRRLITQLTALHLAPTPSAAANPVSEGVPPATVVCTGNTVIDALNWTISRPERSTSAVLRELDADDRRLVLVTVHRRESWGAPIVGVARALATIARANPTCSSSSPPTRTRLCAIPAADPGGDRQRAPGRAPPLRHLRPC